MDIKELAWFLLIGQIGSACFISAVVYRQIILFRRKTDSSLIWFRRVLFVLALVIFFGNAVPMGIDIITVMGLVTRSAVRINTIGLYYTISNTLVAFASSVLIWLLYRLASKTVLIGEVAEEARINDMAGEK